MAAVRDCMCVLEHSMPNLARYMRDAARTGDASAEDHAFDASSAAIRAKMDDLQKKIDELLARGEGEKNLAIFRPVVAQATDLSRRKRELAEELRSKGGDHALDCMPNLNAVRDARARDQRRIGSAASGWPNPLSYKGERYEMLSSSTNILPDDTETRIYEIDEPVAGMPKQIQVTKRGEVYTA